MPQVTRFLAETMLTTPIYKAEVLRNASLMLSTPLYTDLRSLEYKLHLDKSFLCQSNQQYIVTLPNT